MGESKRRARDRGASSRDEAPKSRARRTGLDANVSEHYEALRKLAHRAVTGPRGRRVIDPTELVHESYLLLERRSSEIPPRRTEFIALAASVLRSVLVDRARELASIRRGGQHKRVTLSGVGLKSPEKVDLVDLDTALVRLSALDPRQSRIVELKTFGGLSIDEIAAYLGVSPRTIDAEWALARAWLHRELGN